MRRHFDHFAPLAQVSGRNTGIWVQERNVLMDDALHLLNRSTNIDGTSSEWVAVARASGVSVPVMLE